VSKPVVADSKIEMKPEECVCFGTIDPNHAECQKCMFNKQCAEKSKK
jgi:hypothetical protein